MSPRACLTVALLVLASCRVEHVAASKDPSGEGRSDSVSRCVGGDRAAGEQIVAELHAARRAETPWDLAAQQAILRDACERGCGSTCLAIARESFVPAEIAGALKKACELGEQRGCELLSADRALAERLCEAGEMLGCVTLLRQSEAERGDLAQRIAEVAARRCSEHDGRACSAHAWTRCALLGECDGEAIDAARAAARLLPEPQTLETLALVQCHAGHQDDATATLASACTAGLADACDRRCEQLLGTSVLIRDRSSHERAVLLLLLQNDADPTWFVALSAMDEAELEAFVASLEAFTPPITAPAAKVPIPAGLREQHPALIEAIIRSPQLDEKQIRYWFRRLSEMTDEQRQNLLDSLRKQWWFVPSDESRTPHALVERCLLEGP